MKIFALPILLFLLISEVLGQDKLDIYYLSIGAANYEHDTKKFKEKGFVPYDNLPEAILSANIIANVFTEHSAAKGRIVLSTDTRLVTKKRLFAEIDSVKAMIKKDRPKNPFFILYYCGHGISENLAWNQYLIPGDYTYIAGTKKFDDINKHLIWLGDLADTLKKLPYMIMVDCCRKEEADNEFPEKRMRYFFSDQNVETFKTIVGALRYINEFHQSSPIIFSIVPGQSAPTVDIPDKQKVAAWKLDTSLQIGPLCRRMLLAMNAIDNGRTISISSFVRMITDSLFDSGSPTAVSFYESEEDKLKSSILLRK